MILRRTGDLSLIKELNKSIVLDLIRKKGPISRAEIAKTINISPTTVTSAVSELIDDLLVYENGLGTSNGGRKPILVQLNPNNRFLIGIAIDASKITIAELNLNAEVRIKEVYYIQQIPDFELSNFTLDMIDKFSRKCKDLDQCLGISITTQGIVDSVNGIILYNPKLKIKNLHLKRMIEKTFNIPTYIDNDTNGNLLAEKGFGKYQQSKNVIYIKVGNGVGASILVNDSIFRGFHGGAGEFGHTTIDHNGATCSCGNVGCLEGFVSWSAVNSNVLEAMENGEYTILSELTGGDPSRLTPELFRQAITKEDPLSLSILKALSKYLATGIVNLINLFNPEIIIVGGELAFENPLLINMVYEHISNHALEAHTKGLKIVPSSFGSDFEVIGSASLLLHELFHFTLSK